MIFLSQLIFFASIVILFILFTFNFNGEVLVHDPNLSFVKENDGWVLSENYNLYLSRFFWLICDISMPTEEALFKIIGIDATAIISQSLYLITNWLPLNVLFYVLLAISIWIKLYVTIGELANLIAYKQMLKKNNFPCENTKLYHYNLIVNLKPTKTDIDQELKALPKTTKFANVCVALTVLISTVLTFMLVKLTAMLPNVNKYANLICIAVMITFLIVIASQCCDGFVLSYGLGLTFIFAVILGINSAVLYWIFTKLNPVNMQYVWPLILEMDMILYQCLKYKIIPTEEM